MGFIEVDFKNKPEEANIKIGIFSSSGIDVSTPDDIEAYNINYLIIEIPAEAFKNLYLEVKESWSGLIFDASMSYRFEEIERRSNYLHLKLVKRKRKGGENGLSIP